ncbi:endoplasmic reticulum metallopeptidase [Thraustotheca clavata]|uniref:Endoplasmic reticulum metallopeptidase n=1 Tax=Thraustotheca clavata TaxID=74557 RepID=A0A1W0A7Z9_9STRA|nr:endoplasmic reticulum metallopeptidase [Thraustotheca clavata]
MYQRKNYAAASAPIPLHDDKKEKKRKIQYVNVWGVLLWLVLVYGFIGYRHVWLPEPKEASIPLHEFSEMRTRMLLEELQAIPGIRTLGSYANEHATPKWLMDHLKRLKTQCIKPCVMDIEVQTPSGAFGLNFLAQFQNVYANVSNILVRLHASSDLMPPALLLSSHYDAAIGAAAASDDGVNVAIMLELMQNAVVNPPTKTAVMFNFNGAEETFLQASHGFITQHPWKPSIAAFINLEAAGAGGRELLFQTGSDVLAMAYAHGAPYPHTSTITHEIFKSGVVPGETDYRTYSQYGGVPGMDFAYVANGYVYHTPLDDISRIQFGAIQRFGDNLSGTIQKLFDNPEALKSIGTLSQDHVFFDVFGYTTFTLSTTISTAIHLVIIAFAFSYMSLISPITWREKLSTVGVLLKLSASGYASALVVMVILSLYAPMSWFASPLTRAWVFVFPCVAGFLYQFTNREPRIENVQAIVESQSFMWLIVALPMHLRSLHSVYIVMAWAFFPLAAQIAATNLNKLSSYSTKKHVVLLLTGIAIPLLHLIQIFIVALQVFIPIMGRGGTGLPSDIVIGTMVSILTLLTLSALTPVFCFINLNQLKQTFIATISLTLACIFISCISHAYSTNCPKRLILQHVHRNFSRLGSVADIKEDSGLWVNGFDFQGVEPLRPILTTSRWAKYTHSPKPISFFKTIYDNFPWVYPIAHLMPIKNTWYLQTSNKPTFKVPTHLEVLSSQYDETLNLRRVHLVLSGPSQMNVFIDATTTRLKSWSLGNGTDGVPPQIEDVYLIQFSNGGLNAAEFHFWLDVHTNASLDIAYCGHYFDTESPELRELQSLLPPWATHASFVSSWSILRV